MRHALAAAVVLAVATVACTAFDGADPGGGGVVTPADGGAAAPGRLACLPCDDASTCVRADAAALCPDTPGSAWTSYVEPNNPPVVCRPDAVELTSPSTLDAWVTRTFAVDQLKTVEVGLRVGVRGVGRMLQIGPVSLRGKDGPADTTDYEVCQEQDVDCQKVFSAKDTEVATHELLFRATVTGRESLWTVAVDACGTPVDERNVTDFPDRLEIRFGPISTSTDALVRVEALAVRRVP